MKKTMRIGGYFETAGENLLEFKSANVLKSSVLTLFYILLFILAVTDISMVLGGDPSLFHEIVHGPDRASYLVYLFPFILPIIWLFIPATRVTLDRSQGVVHHHHGKRKYDFPWDRISFKHQWIPTKTGGSTLFTLIALPPYPDALQRLIETKARPAPGQVFTFQLGSFDVKGPEHGQAFFTFLDTWMRSREPAAKVYETLVRSRFGT